jgi:tRNA (guanine-N7-)-methyltransferase
MDVGHFGLLQADLLKPAPPGGIDPRQWFAPDRRGNPLELEIGSGKGTFLVRQAKQYPQVNYWGIEWSMPFWRFSADRCRRHGLENARVLRAEAGAFVREYLPDGCVREVHIYFPDPWPKTRHNKRRLIQAPFLRELYRVLEKPGAIRIVTDHADYFQWIKDHAAQVADLFTSEPLEERPAGAGPGEIVGTNFERKYQREGRPFYAMLLRTSAF